MLCALNCALFLCINLLRYARVQRELAQQVVCTSSLGAASLPASTFLASTL